MTKKNGTIKCYDVGSDIGNDSIKIVMLETGADINELNNNEKSSRCYDNIYATDVKVEYKNGYLEEAELADMLDVTVSVNDGITELLPNGLPGCFEEKLIVGNIVRDNKEEYKERRNNYKADEDSLVTTSLAFLANFIIEETSEEERKENMEVNVNYCIGLPYHEYDNEEKLTLYKAKFKGPHIVKFNCPYYPVKEMKININTLSVESEGFSALKAVMLLNNFKNSYVGDLFEQAVALTDIGSYTTDMVGGYFKPTGKIDKDGEEILKFEPLSQLCQGIRVGIGTAYDKTADDLSEEHKSVFGNNETISKKDMNIAMKSTKNRGYIRGKKVHMEPFISQHLRKLGKDNGLALADMYAKANYQRNLIKIFLCGGGSNFPEVVESFKNGLQSKGIDPNIVEIINNPIPTHANAVGYFLNAKVKAKKV